jgi:O-antigen ligase
VTLKFEKIMFGIVLALTAWLSNMRSFVSWNLHPATREFSEQASLELAGWFLTTLLVLRLMQPEGNLLTYRRKWRQQPLLIAFLAICTASLLWTVDQTVTLFRVAVILNSTVIAAYIGMRWRPVELLRYLSWFAIAVVLASCCMVLTEPMLGMQRYYGPGVWRGIFWNKNHLGSIAALCSGLLLLRLVDIRRATGYVQQGLFVLAYFGALLLAYKSHSAAGYLLVLIVHATALMSLFWICYAKHMQRRHYVLLSVIGVLLTTIMLTNLDSIFGTLGRNTTLTGRTALWAYLLQDVVSDRPFLGYGLGALWGDSHFRARIFEKIGWSQPVIGDNGFMDILLGVGTIGLAACMMVFFTAWKGAVGCMVREKSVASCLPLLVMSFALFANISFSLLTEIEVLVWGLIVAILFATADLAVPLVPADEADLSRRWASRSP